MSVRQISSWEFSGISELFDFLPMVVFYTKDRDGVFIRCNRRFEEMHGLSVGGGVGLTDYDLHAPEIASRYRAEDQRVMETGMAVPNRAWMVPDGNGVLRWWISSKVALKDETDEVYGVAGAMYEISGMGGVMEPFGRLAPALKMIHDCHGEGIGIGQMAAACHYSVSQFNRVFGKLMGQSPQQYLIRHRLEAAKRMLVQSNESVAEIALRVGFYDASVFGKKFREMEGITPRMYRLKLRELVEVGR